MKKPVLHRVQTLISLAIFCMLMLFSTFTAQGDGLPEDHVKAAMLYNFALFVEWPPDAFKADTDPFVVCLLGKDLLDPSLNYELDGTSIGTHPVEIRRLGEDAAGSRACHILFISRSEERHIHKILNQLGTAPVLTVSDVSDPVKFCRDGGMIAFIRKDRKIRFTMNTEAMNRAGLKSDSRLKRIAIAAECGEEH